VDERLKGLRDTLRMEAEEVVSLLTDIGRDKQHKDQMAALDKLARIHGLYNDKIAIETDRRALLDAIEQEIKRLTSSSIDVEAKVVESKLLPPKPPTVES
jgi:phosphoenolpyruvate-protein kinase (PTS system EI component)